MSKMYKGIRFSVEKTFSGIKYDLLRILEDFQGNYQIAMAHFLFEKETLWRHISEKKGELMN